MASSPRPDGVLVAPNALLWSSHCVLPRSCGVIGGVHGACTFSLRLRGALGVCTAVPRRSGTVLTVCRQNRNEF